MTILVSVSVSLGTTDVVLEYNFDTLTIGQQTRKKKTEIATYLIAFWQKDTIAGISLEKGIPSNFLLKIPSFAYPG